MSFLSDVINAIKRIERTIGLKDDYNVDTIFARLNKLETQNNNDILMHKRNLGTVVIPAGYNAVLKNPVVFDELTVEDDADLILL